MKEYDKLVRDDIPDRIEDDGEVPTIDIVEGEAYRDRLHAKLREEVREFREAPSAAEAADIQEVFDALLAAEGIDRAAVERARTEKADNRGRFEEGVVLKTVETVAEETGERADQS